jgi:hypothetical protein
MRQISAWTRRTYATNDRLFSILLSQYDLSAGSSFQELLKNILNLDTSRWKSGKRNNVLPFELAFRLIENQMLCGPPHPAESLLKIPKGTPLSNPGKAQNSIRTDKHDLASGVYETKYSPFFVFSKTAMSQKGQFTGDQKR